MLGFIAPLTTSPIGRLDAGVHNHCPVHFVCPRPGSQLLLSMPQCPIYSKVRELTLFVMPKSFTGAEGDMAEICSPEEAAAAAAAAAPTSPSL